jgi:hypothetical protein
MVDISRGYNAHIGPSGVESIESSSGHASGPASEISIYIRGSDTSTEMKLRTLLTLVPYMACQHLDVCRDSRKSLEDDPDPPCDCNNYALIRSIDAALER